MLAVSPPGDAGRLFVGERAGTVRILRRDGSKSVFLDIPDDVLTGGERGLLGLAFHPDFGANGLFYLHYSVRRQDCTAGGSPDHCGRIAEYQVSATDPDAADPSSRRILLDIPQPASNHNGGWIGFGPMDGHLYIALGDGGGANDQFGNGQNLQSLLGTILRLDVSGDPYQPVEKVRPRRGRIFSAISALPNLGILAVFLRFGALIISALPNLGILAVFLRFGALI